MEHATIPYLTLDAHVEAAIRADRAAGRLHPHRFDDADVVRRERNPHDDATLTRPAFARDIEKILNVPAYNRYADKTQVFSFVENDDISRRGLHVQLVSRVARGIGSLLGLKYFFASFGARIADTRTLRGLACPEDLLSRPDLCADLERWGRDWAVRLAEGRP